MIINQLPSVPSAADADEIVVEIGTTTYKIKKSDFLKEFMKKSGGEFTGDVTVNGVLYVTPRRCYAVQLDAGWHRVLTFTASSAVYSRGGTGNEIVFHITRRRTTAGEETHEIKMLCGYDGIKFVDETSSSTSGYQRIYKIRYTYSGNNGYVDINCTGACAHTTVAFEVYCEPAYQALYTAASLQSVADSPSGETVLTEHTFIANGHNFTMPVYMNGTLLHS